MKLPVELTDEQARERDAFYFAKQMAHEEELFELAYAKAHPEEYEDE